MYRYCVLYSLLTSSDCFCQALRVSMEEQRQRQEDEARRAAVTSAAEAGISSPAADGDH